MTTTTPGGPVDLPFPTLATRRVVLGGALAGMAGVTGIALIGAPGAGAVAVPMGTDRARYLTPERLATLRAIVDRVVPDEDGTPGAVAAGCHEAIDALLGAFRTDPPRIYAGGPFSDRGGSKVNHFARFLPLDRYERQAWRLRIKGSNGKRGLHHNGAYLGYQKTYNRGLDALEAANPGFASLPGPIRDAILRDSSDPAVTAMLGLAVGHTFETCYGAPEYGGNRNGVAWDVIGFDGDRQPRGYTDEEVTSPETELLPIADLTAMISRFGPALALATSEAMLGPLTSGVEGHRQVAAQVQDWLRGYDDALATLREVSSRRDEGSP